MCHVHLPRLVDRYSRWVPARSLQRLRTNAAIPLACMAIAILRRGTAWDPASLWLDDIWMALPLRNLGFEQILALHLPSPIGFLALEKLAGLAAGDLEWPLQIVPALCGLLAIPLFYRVMRRLVTDRWALGLACLLVACHPTAELYAMRVKHYACDVLVVIGLLGLMLSTLQSPSIARFFALVVVGLAGALFSFASLFVSLCFVHALLADRAVRAYRARQLDRLALGYAVGAGRFDAGVRALHKTLLESQSSTAMKAFWQAYFLHFDSLPSVLLWIGRRLFAFPMYALSAWLIVLLPLVFVGARAVARDSTLRPLVWAWLGLIAGLVLAAALDIYPMGNDRTGLFAYPLFWAFAAVGCERVRAPTLSQQRAKLQTACALYVVGICLLRPPVEYSDARDRQAVEETLRRRRDGDGLLVQPSGLLALAYYGDRPLRFVRDESVCHRFAAWPDWSDLFVLPSTLNGRSVRDEPSVADAVLDEYYARRYLRIVYLSTHASDATDARVVERAARGGYRVQRIDESSRARVFIFERASPGLARGLKT
jgi:hypothetical protein